VVGELISIEENNIYIKPFEDTELVVVPMEEIEKARLYIYDRGEPKITLLSGLGLMFFSFSHGVFSAFTLPLAIMLTFFTTTIDYKKRYQVIILDYDIGTKLIKLKEYARFPQGAPQAFKKEARKIE